MFQLQQRKIILKIQVARGGSETGEDKKGPFLLTKSRSRAAGHCPRKCTTMASRREVVSYPPRRESRTKLTFSSSDKLPTDTSTSRKFWLPLGVRESAAFLALFSIIFFTVADILLLACKGIM